MSNNRSLPAPRVLATRRLVIFATALLLATPQAFADESRGIRIDGKLSVTTDERHSRLAIASPEHDYILYLPYAEDWRFSTKRDAPLEGRTPRYTLALVQRPRTDDDPGAELDGALDELLGANADVRFLQFIRDGEGQVLCLQVRHAEGAPWHWFYWSLIPREDDWLQVTILEADPGELEPLDMEMAEVLARSTTLTQAMGKASD